ncbi:MAG: hypothetical protein AAGB34_02410 [Planctomycetota bacterium]
MNSDPHPSHQPTVDTTQLRKVRASTIMWLGSLLGFMGIVAMAVATIMLAVGVRSTVANERASSEPLSLTSPGVAISPDDRFKLIANLSAVGEVKYSITTVEGLQRIDDGGFNPGDDPWVIAWDADSNVWIRVKREGGYSMLHRLKQVVSYVDEEGWVEKSEFAEVAPPAAMQ